MKPDFDPGKKPQLKWLPVAQLSVDHRYQRTLESRRSQLLVDRIAERFRWGAFAAATVRLLRDAARREQQFARQGRGSDFIQPPSRDQLMGRR